MQKNEKKKNKIKQPSKLQSRFYSAVHFQNQKAVPTTNFDNITNRWENESCEW